MAKNILIIDDEELLIKSLTKLLEKNGYSTYVAKNGQDAIVMAEEEIFDLIIADIRMPGINGVETVKKIYRDIKQIPVIFVTGYADEKVEKEAQSLQPIAYIYKPFDIKELLEKVKKTLG